MQRRGVTVCRSCGHDFAAVVGAAGALEHQVD